MQHCCGNIFLSSSSLGGGQRVEGGLPKRDQRTESQTEGKIQYFTLASISSLVHPRH